MFKLMLEFLGFGFEMLTIFGPIAIYLPQYKQMAKTKSCGSFSQLICFALILSSVLRIIFWFDKKVWKAV